MNLVEYYEQIGVNIYAWPGKPGCKTMISESQEIMNGPSNEPKGKILPHKLRSLNMPV